MIVNEFRGIGYVGANSKLAYTSNMTAILNFSLGINANEGTNWIECRIIGSKAEKLKNLVLKGAEVLVSGSLETEQYTRKKDGAKIKKYYIFVRDLRVLKDTRVRVKLSPEL